jgi:hypothetical protein
MWFREVFSADVSNVRTPSFFLVVSGVGAEPWVAVEFGSWAIAGYTHILRRL